MNSEFSSPQQDVSMSQFDMEFNDIPVFRDVSNDICENVLALMNSRKFEEGQFLFIEGTIGEGAYVLMEGEVELLEGTSQKPEEELVATLRAPSWFGIKSFLIDEPATITARAKTDVQVLELPKMAFFDRIQQGDQELLPFGFRLSRYLLDRVYQMDAAFVRLIEELEQEIEEEQNTDLEWVLHDVREIRTQLFHPTFKPESSSS